MAVIKVKPSWGRDKVCASLRPLTAVLEEDKAPELSEMAQKYCQFYGIDKDKQIAGVEHYIGYFEAAGFKLVTHYFKRAVGKGSLYNGDRSTPLGESKGTVFVFHGYFDHTGLYGHIIEHLLRSAYDVIIYDLPGHGLSSGESVAINRFTQYTAILETCLSICKGLIPGPWFAVGQSTGSAVLLAYLFKYRFQQGDTPFQHWVFLAPLLRPVGWTKLLILHRLLGRFLKSWKREFLPNSHDAAFVHFLREKDPLQVKAISVKWAGALKDWVKDFEASPPIQFPVTIIQGPEDGTVDWRYNIPKLKQMLPLADIKLLSRGRHQLVNEAPKIREKVFKLLISAMDAKHDP